MGIKSLLGAAFICLIIVSFNSSAALHGRLPTTPGGTVYQAYYDDVADLTWLQDANAGGQMDWWDANAWAAGLDVEGVTGWRLPDTLQPDTSCDSQSSGGNAYVGYNCTGSEMGNLFYNVLGNTAGSLTNTSPFSNVQLSWYWSATETDFSTFSAWAFSMGDGDQDYLSRATYLYTWAVHDGDVGILPIPATVEIDIAGGNVQECSQTNGALVSATANITLDPDDAVSGISWLLDGVNAGNDTEFSQFVTLGTHQIEVNITTVNGDTASDIATVTVEDTQPPIVTAQFINRLTGEPINTIQPSRNLIEINAEASDVCDPSAAVIDAIYGNPSSDGSVFLAIGFGGGLVTPQNQLVLRVVAQDASGNRASAFSVLSAP